MGFLEMMVGSAANRCGLAGKVIYEIGSDPHFLSAQAMIRHGARFVIATNLGTSWHYEPPQQTIATSLDIRRATQELGTASVDMVYGVNIMEHINDLPLALDAIRAVLKPGAAFFLHGHPIWTGATGHHTLYHDYTFGGPKDPLPPWSHLYMNAAELRAHLHASGPADGAESIATLALESDELNRTPLRHIEAAFTASGLMIAGADKTRTDAPRSDTLDRIKASQWWDEAEDYAVRQATWWGTK